MRRSYFQPDPVLTTCHNEPLYFYTYLGCIPHTYTRLRRRDHAGLFVLTGLSLFLNPSVQLRAMVNVVRHRVRHLK